MRVLDWIVAGGMLAAAAASSAQQGKTDEGTITVLPSRVVTIAPACPVGFHASIDPRLTLREVKNGKKDVDATLVRLLFDGVGAKKTIVSASVTAHGVAPHGELMLVGQRPDEERTQAFSLTLAKGLPQTEINVTAVPFVRWVELNLITYADGTIWHAAEGATCTSVLSKFHPV